ncbi:major facilitator superfamily domain-containing protein [Xylaria intraflava]|nr:major facilitator superfamily domain-containing protein [Xylaria intraflava]
MAKTRPLGPGDRSDMETAAEDAISDAGSDVSTVGRTSHDGIEEDAIGYAVPSSLHEVARTGTGTSAGSAAQPPDLEVTFGDDDNPKKWPLWYRAWVLFSVSLSTWTVVVYSTTYTSSIPGLTEQFHIQNQTIATLGVTTYLIGLALGSLLWAPVSELYGRKPVYVVCMTIYTLMILPSCFATSLTEILVTRFIGALFGAAMVSISSGTVVDISTEENRALILSLWSIAPLNGPVTGPVIGGFVFQYLGWRWDNWIVLILAGASTVAVCTTKETYTPRILQDKAARMRKETGDERWWTRYQLNLTPVQLLKRNLVRPFVLFFTEPILWFFNLWISVVYGILYLCFVAYPIVFSQYRGWGPGITGLSFVGIGIGTTVVILGEPLWRRIINQHPVDPETGRRPPEAAGRVLIIGALLTPIGQLVFAWTCLPVTIHWAIPIAFGILFGMGNSFTFIYGANYLSGAYGIYAASALAGNALTRSLLGGLLPLAGPSLYTTLSPQWAGTLLGLLEVALVPIPFIFWRYGAKIRARSPAIRALREDQERLDRQAAKQQRKQEMLNHKASGNVSGAETVAEKKKETV